MANDRIELDGGRVVLYRGDWFEVGPTLREKSVHCVVTSPPYFALRSYLPADHPDKPKELGSEQTPKQYLETMVRAFRLVRRAMRDDAVMFLNMGDGYSDSGKGGGGSYAADGMTHAAGTRRTPGPGGPGELLNIPHRLAEALRADGWHWRQTIVWAKRSPGPESVRGWRWERHRIKVAPQGRSQSRGIGLGAAGRNLDSSRNPDLVAKWADCPGCEKCNPHGGYVLRRGKGRCTTAHEYVFVMTKGTKYFWDSVASAELCVDAKASKEYDASHEDMHEMQQAQEREPVPQGATGPKRPVCDVQELRTDPARCMEEATGESRKGSGVVAEIPSKPAGETEAGGICALGDDEASKGAVEEIPCRASLLQRVPQIRQEKDRQGEILQRQRQGHGVRVEQDPEAPGATVGRVPPPQDAITQRSMRPDGRPVDANQKVSGVPLCNLPEEEAPDAGPHHPPIKGRGAHVEQHSSSLPVLQLSQTRQVKKTRNPRSVWLLSSEPTSEPHYASFPSELVRRCLSAGISVGGCCPKCGAPWAPVVEEERSFESGSGQSGNKPAGKYPDGVQGGGETGDLRRGPVLHTECLGYWPTCDCGEKESAPCVVLDPFSGIGTVAQTARVMGARAIGVELNAHYHKIACRRVMESPRWWIRKHGAPPKVAEGQMVLFPKES